MCHGDEVATGPRCQPALAILWQLGKALQKLEDGCFGLGDKQETSQKTSSNRLL